MCFYVQLQQKYNRKIYNIRNLKNIERSIVRNTFSTYTLESNAY